MPTAQSTSSRWYVVYRAALTTPQGRTYVYIGRKACKPGHVPSGSPLGIDAGYSRPYKGSGKIWARVREKYPAAPRTYEILSKHRSEQRQFATEQRQIALARAEHRWKCVNIHEGGSSGFGSRTGRLFAAKGAAAKNAKYAGTEEQREWARKAVAATNAKKDANGKSVAGSKGGTAAHTERLPDGRSAAPLRARAKVFGDRVYERKQFKPPLPNTKRAIAAALLARQQGASETELLGIGKKGRDHVSALRNDHGYRIELIAPATWRIRDDCPSHA